MTAQEIRPEFYSELAVAIRATDGFRAMQCGELTDSLRRQIAEKVARDCSTTTDAVLFVHDEWGADR